MKERMRTVRFNPYRKGHGPTFTLTLFDIGKERIGYELKMHESGKSTPLFSGEDFKPSPLHSIDGDDAVAALMNFLTLRPGDTDPDYFADYTDTQSDYASQHAESLGMEVINRFGER